MLPRVIYQLLPYIYIALGVVCMLIVESRLIFFSSSLLIAAGVLVLWMRQKNSVEPAQSSKDSEALKAEEIELLYDEVVSMPDHERRIGDDRRFPLVDDNGVMIPFERRSHESGKDS